MKEEKWEFNYTNINSMINDYFKLDIGNEELKDHVYDFIQDSITKSTHNLTTDEMWKLLNRLQS